MKKYIIGLAFLLLPSVAFAQLGGGNPAPGIIGGSNTFSGGNSAVFSQTAAVTFEPISGLGTGALVAATEGDAMLPVPALTCRNLVCNAKNIAGAAVACGGTSWTIAVDKNTAATALTCVCGTAATTCSDVTHSFTTVAGDELDFGWTPAGAPTAVVGKCTVECNF